MRVSRVLWTVLVLVLVSGVVYAGMDAKEDLFGKLMEGNRHFAGGELANRNTGEQRRQELTKGQHPFAIVLSCSDSRVPPEMVFDQGLGDIFVVRVAGNVVEPTTLGSIEYGVEHLHIPLLVILGHEKCGAVMATMEAKGKPEGNIGAIIRKIMPAVKTAKKSGKGGDETLQLAIQENVRNTYKDILRHSHIVREFVHEGKLQVVGAEYYLASGRVEPVGLETASSRHQHAH